MCTHNTSTTSTDSGAHACASGPGAQPTEQAAAGHAHGAAMACGCGGDRQGMHVTDEVRWTDAKVDMEFPPVPFPSSRVFAVAGEAGIRALVARHHERLKTSPIAGLYPTDADRFAFAVKKAADYTVEACGGPAHFTPVHGNTCMRTRHFPFTIDEHAREVWLAHLFKSFDDVGFPQEVRREYWEWQEAMSIRMINRRTRKDAPRRYTYADAALAFSERPEVAPHAELETHLCTHAGGCPR